MPSQIEIVPPHKKDLSLKNPESRHPHPTKKKQPGSNIYTYNCIHNMHIDIYSTCFQTFIYIYTVYSIYIYTHISLTSHFSHSICLLGMGEDVVSPCATLPI